jgi:phage repressor protein C with HTH and peptisase S24 domain
MLVDFPSVVDKIRARLQEEQTGTILDKDIARALDMTPAHFSRAKAGLTSPLGKLINYALKNRININWLLYDQIPESLEKETEKLIHIKYFKSVRGSAGGGSIVDNEQFEYIALPASSLLHLSSTHIEAIDTIGDSMEPLIPENATVLIDRNATDPKEHKVYALSCSEGLFVKKICIDENRIQLISENSSYTTINIESESLHIIGEVIGIIE